MLVSNVGSSVDCWWSRLTGRALRKSNYTTVVSFLLLMMDTRQDSRCRQFPHLRRLPTGFEACPDDGRAGMAQAGLGWAGWGGWRTHRSQRDLRCLQCKQAR